MSSKANPQQQESHALDVERGRITCSSVERRRLLEQVGKDHEVTFVGDAEKAGRQADEGDYLQEDGAREETGFAECDIDG